MTGQRPEIRGSLEGVRFSWQSQARQYPAHGPAGVGYFAGDVSELFGPGAHVDCLLHRDRDGALTGLLNFYPIDMPPFEQAGNVLVMVRPDRRRTGIATMLLAVALRRWPIDLHTQRYTREGAALVAAYLDRTSGQPAGGATS
jgi:GNAT superfamily N-acetyltransferase